MQSNNHLNVTNVPDLIQEESEYKPNTQDQSTQAMTEVALALSMAFFSLLLLALISMGVPVTQEDVSSKSEKTRVPEFILSTSESATTSENDEHEQETQYIFYFEGRFYDQYMAQTQTSMLDQNKKLIVAMPLETDVSKALSLQQEFARFDVSLTLMNAEWLAAFKANMIN